MEVDVPQSLHREPKPVSRIQTTFIKICQLCGSDRQNGSFLAYRPTTTQSTLWVCNDCQKKISRRVDDEGTLGG